MSLTRHRRADDAEEPVSEADYRDGVADVTECNHDNIVKLCVMRRSDQDRDAFGLGRVLIDEFSRLAPEVEARRRPSR